MPCRGLVKTSISHLQRIASNSWFVPSSRFSASFCLKSIISCNPRDLALTSAIANISVDISVAVTCPCLPTIFVALIAGSPIPVAISYTRCPGLIAGSSIKLSLTYCAPFSKVFHHFCHALATLSELCYWLTLNLSASNLEFMLVDILPCNLIKILMKVLY